MRWTQHITIAIPFKKEPPVSQIATRIPTIMTLPVQESDNPIEFNTSSP